MIRTLVIPVFLFFAIACNETTEKRPAHVLDETKMVEVMVDMHLVETANNLKIIGPDSTDSNYRNLFGSVFVNHNVTKAEFDSSLYYYATKTDQMNTIYDRVLENLSQLEAEVNSGQ